MQTEHWYVPAALSKPVGTKAHVQWGAGTCVVGEDTCVVVGDTCVVGEDTCVVVGGTCVWGQAHVFRG